MPGSFCTGTWARSRAGNGLVVHYAEDVDYLWGGTPYSATIPSGVKFEGETR